MSVQGAFKYDDLVYDNRNMLVAARWPFQKLQFLDYLTSQTSTLSALVSHHLSLRANQTCTVAARSNWLYGSYNVCIPVDISNCQTPRVVIRCPFPHINHPEVAPQLTDEKIRGEAATWAWLVENCPGVPVAGLHGFGTADGTSFTPLRHCSWIRRVFEYIRHGALMYFGIESWRPFVAHIRPASLHTGYTIMDFVGPQRGTMLGNRFRSSTNTEFTSTLHRSLAGILLEMLKVPLPKIGAFTVYKNGEVALGSRPLTPPLAQLEAQGVPSGIAPDTTYARGDTYVEDLIRSHELRLTHQPNAVIDDDDAKDQMATIVVLKALRSAFICPDSLAHHTLQFTDMNTCNIFVNEQGEITAMLDLEFTCSLPIQMLRPPFWLSGHVGDDFFGDEESAKNVPQYDTVAQDFFETLAQLECKNQHLNSTIINARLAMQAAFAAKSHWFFEAVHFPAIAYNFLFWHLQPMVAPHHLGDGNIPFRQALFPYYSPTAADLAQKKVHDYSDYLEKLKAMT